MLGHSVSFQRLSILIDKYAGCEASVLLEGEKGMGKEVAVRGIHYRSARCNMPFAPINCGAIPETDTPGPAGMTRALPAPALFDESAVAERSAPKIIEPMRTPTVHAAAWTIPARAPLR